jgi:hypothetical protein
VILTAHVSSATKPFEEKIRMVAVIEHLLTYKRKIFFFFSKTYFWSSTGKKKKHNAVATCNKCM